mgnify:FL=1
MLITNYRKHRKADYYTLKAEVQAQIQEIYHSHNGVDGYRSMKVYLERKGYSYSNTTVHKYMNTELGLRSVVRPKNQDMSMETRIKYSIIS